MRPDGKWVRAGEAAIAGLPVFHCAKPSADGRVGSCEVGILHAAVFFDPQGRVIPAQAEFDCQRVSDFPAILQIQRIRMHAQPRTCLGRGHLKAAGQAQQEAGIAHSAAGVIRKRLAVLRGIGGLEAGEFKFSIGAAAGDGRNALEHRRRAQLEGMVSLDPGRVGVKGRLYVLLERRFKERSRVGAGGEATATGEA